ncbi:helix-turn-helix transcriptional regulator [Paenibacillus montanisoli]|uniref:AraC family transcriptional regulator n=1 Tax=Paenibacillus montanisoli TaxID=2081970 RepID=A0A328U524_9BACL|nr:AraC family transcriptional regulator [Paenibacillus montanisoli]RAP74996.1 AraC family transcriptional regulator [Paenibacillus montanisoli]
MREYSLYHPRWREGGDYRPNIEAYYYKQWLELDMEFHAHDAIEFMYVISGTCTVETRSGTILMRKGDLILLDSGVVHRLIVPKETPCRMLNVEFTFTECRGIYPSLKQLAHGDEAFAQLLDRKISTIVLRDPSDVHHTLKSIVMEMDTGGTHRDSMSHLMLSQLLIRVARLAAEEAQDSAGGQHHRYVRKAAEYIHQHYDCDIQSKDVADAVNLHPVYLQRIFKANMNTTMTDYLAELRIEKAKMLLARTDIPIIEIAGYIGLNSRQYFSMLFKKLTGMSPAAYRKSIETMQGFDKRVEIVDMS